MHNNEFIVRCIPYLNCRPCLLNGSSNETDDTYKLSVHGKYNCLHLGLDQTCVRHSTSTSVRYTPREKRKLATLEHWQICNTDDSYGWCCSTRRWGHQLRELSSPVHTQESAYLQAARKNYARLEHWLRWNRNTGPGGTGTLALVEQEH